MHRLSSLYLLQFFLVAVNTLQGAGENLPNKQKPVKNTRLFGLFHTSDTSLSRDNSRVVEVIVDDLITGLGPSFYTAKT